MYSARIHKIIGQLEALERLLNDGRIPCEKMLQQVNAVQGAMTSLKRTMIDESFEKCLESRHAHKETKKLLTSIRRYL